MIRRFWFAAMSGAFIVTTVVLMSGCKTKESVVSEEQSKQEVFSQEPKEIDVDSKMVELKTSMGEIVIELNEEAAPVTVKNFLQYVEDGFFDGTIFHRVIPSFMIQGGGFTANMQRKGTQPAIVNEAANGLKNDRGTVAMARTNDPDSATSQFFINHKDNEFLNYTGPGNPGYAVFGKVVQGMEVVDKIAAVKTTRTGPYSDVPVEPVVIESAKLVSSSKSD
jgi:cyclophilin family peptidyl-prolyl cis-trans isomerase